MFLTQFNPKYCSDEMSRHAWIKETNSLIYLLFDSQLAALGLLVDRSKKYF